MSVNVNPAHDQMHSSGAKCNGLVAVCWDYDSSRVAH